MAEGNTQRWTIQGSACGGYTARVRMEIGTPLVIDGPKLLGPVRVVREDALTDANRTIARLREELGHRPTPDNGYCPGCGRYMPKTLNGDQTTCACGRTPPADHLPPNLYACPICRGFAAHPLGCWGTREKPHEHAYMEPIYDALDQRDEAREQLASAEAEIAVDNHLIRTLRDDVSAIAGEAKTFHEQRDKAIEALQQIGHELATVRGSDLEKLQNVAEIVFPAIGEEGDQ